MPARTAQVARAGTRELKHRMDAVKTTKKITDAMRLVAAARVRKAQESVVKSRPFMENLTQVHECLFA